MATILYSGSYVRDNQSNYNSLIPAKVKASFLKYGDLHLTATWDPRYRASFIDSGKKTRTETVRINENVDINKITHYKYFPNDAGNASSWYENPGTLFAGIIDNVGNIRIILDECCGLNAKYYGGTFEPDYLHSIIISTSSFESTCNNNLLFIFGNKATMSVYALCVAET